MKMLIKNAAKKAVISRSGRMYDNTLSKFIGLMFSRNRNRALIFRFKKEKIISLHMLFVFYPIDVLFLDKNKIIVDMKENFRPFAFYNSKKKAMYALELPAAAIRKSRTKIGDRIIF